MHPHDARRNTHDRGLQDADWLCLAQLPPSAEANPKPEYRNSKQRRMTEIQDPKAAPPVGEHVSVIVGLDFEFVSIRSTTLRTGFGFRASIFSSHARPLGPTISDLPFSHACSTMFDRQYTSQPVARKGKSLPQSDFRPNLNTSRRREPPRTQKKPHLTRILLASAGCETRRRRNERLNRWLSPVFPIIAGMTP